MYMIFFCLLVVWNVIWFVLLNMQKYTHGGWMLLKSVKKFLSCIIYMQGGDVWWCRFLFWDIYMLDACVMLYYWDFEYFWLCKSFCMIPVLSIFVPVVIVRIEASISLFVMYKLYSKYVNLGCCKYAVNAISHKSKWRGCTRSMLTLLSFWILFGEVQSVYHLYLKCVIFFFTNEKY